VVPLFFKEIWFGFLAEVLVEEVIKYGHKSAAIMMNQ
jgi:hypothetical protein